MASKYKYCRPELFGFRKPNFLDGLEDWQARIISLVQDRDYGSIKSPWIQIDGHLDDRVAAWRPKLYVGVASRSYKRFVEELILDDELRKYCIGFKAFVTGLGEHSRDASMPSDLKFSRPDKIVFYHPGGAGLAKLIEYLARRLKGVATHSIGHAGRADSYELVAPERAAGLYLGSDPRCLPTSWRFYRPVVLVWLRRHRSKIEAEVGCVSTWLAKLNIDETFEGPLDLYPKDNRSFLISQWDRMVGMNAGSVYG
jgi:hypothetical protein